MVLHDALGAKLEEKCVVVAQVGDTMVPGQIIEAHGGIDLASGQKSTSYVVVLIQQIYTAATPDGLVPGLFRTYEQVPKS